MPNGPVVIMPFSAPVGLLIDGTDADGGPPAGRSGPRARTSFDRMLVVAKVFPKHREPEHDSERRVLAQLRRLDDSWLVFHNIKWQALRRGRQGDGETDFALFHPARAFS